MVYLVSSCIGSAAVLVAVIVASPQESESYQRWFRAIAGGSHDAKPGGAFTSEGSAMGVASARVQPLPCARTPLASLLVIRDSCVVTL